MPLSPAEQRELDQLELQELEEQEKGATPTAAPEETVMDRLKDPERWKAIAGLPSTKRPEMVAGNPPIALPANLAPAAISKLAQFFGAHRKTAGAVQGGLEGAMAPANSLEDRAKNAAIGTGVGLATGIAGDLVEKGSGLLKRVSGRAARMSPAQADVYTQDPKGIHEMADMLDDPLKTPELQDQAVGAINESRKALKAKGMGEAKQLREYLTGKKVPVEAAGLDKLGDEGIDAALRSREIPLNEYARPDVIDLDANQANQIKRRLQDMAAYKPGTVLDPVQEAKQKALGMKAGQIRQSIEGLGPEVGALNKSMQESTLLQEQLRKGAKQNPLAFLSSEAPDRIAALARAEKAGTGGMLEFGKKLGAAKSIASKDVDDALTRTAEKAIGRAGLRSAKTASEVGQAVTGPLTTDQLMKLIAGKE